MKKIDFAKLPNHAPEYDLRELLAAGCHFGHQRSKWNPAMAPYIYTQQEGVHIFDLAKTADQLKKAYNCFYQFGKEKKTVVMVGTKRQARELVQKVAEEAGMKYICSRWLGGFLTNWEQVQKSLSKMIKIEADFKAGKYDKLTKFEQSQLKKELGRLARFFVGLRDLTKLPDAIFVIDPKREKNALQEAAVMGVPVIAMMDSDGNPAEVELAIPANDDAVKSIEYIVTQIGAAYQAGKQA